MNDGRPSISPTLPVALRSAGNATLPCRHRSCVGYAALIRGDRRVDRLRRSLTHLRVRSLYFTKLRETPSLDSP